MTRRMTLTPAPTRRAVALGLAASIIPLPSPASSQTPRGNGEGAPKPPIELVAKRSARRLKADLDQDAALFSYNDQSPGPILRIKKGDALTVRLTNRLDQPTGIHWYGVRGSSAMDGAVGLTQKQIEPGEAYDYILKPPDSGHFWYHPLIRGHSAEQVDRGLAGMLIVDEAVPPAVDQDLAIVIDDWRIEKSGATVDDFLNVPDMARAGRLGNLLTINALAAPQPIRAAPGARLRLRLLNVANARVFPLKVENINARVVGIDGQACDPFDPLRRTVIMTPGSRFDIMVDMPAEGAPEGRISADLGVVLPLVILKAEGEKVAARPPIVALQGNDLPPAIKLQDAQRAELVITGGLPRTGPGAGLGALEAAQKFPDASKIWQLNAGAIGGFSARPMLTVRRGSPVVLALSNRTSWAQVIHVHGYNFRLLHPFDDGWEPYFLDTLYLPEGQTSHISFIADNPGRWAIRSSILEHFEGGVATWFEVR